MLDRLIYANPGISAENAVSRVRGTFSSSDFSDSTWTTERAPVDPNVYTDGGVQNPASRAWATGTFGVFWPNRSLSDYPLNSVEADYAKSSQVDDGLELWGYLSTPACSSTRAEVMAIVLAISADGPVHIASDSKSAISKARFYCQQIKHSHEPPTWTTVVDGDLWRHFWLSVSCKGQHSIAFTKVKGHATLAHQHAGVISAIDRAGNTRAGQLATRARRIAKISLGRWRASLRRGIEPTMNLSWPSTAFLLACTRPLLSFALPILGMMVNIAKFLFLGNLDMLILAMLRISRSRVYHKRPSRTWMMGQNESWLLCAHDLGR